MKLWMGPVVVGICLLVSTGVCSQTSFSQTAGPLPAASPAATAAPVGAREKIRRWVEIEQLSLAARYHFIELEDRRKSANNLQYQFAGRLRFRFDGEGRYSVVANAATGSAFTSGWNNTGLGTGDVSRDVFLKQFYLDARPTRAIEVQAGGLFVNNGLSTEATQYDNDGYITGERLLVRKPQKLYFDQVSVTYARLADLTTPNVFRRFRHFGRQNYHQFLVQKQVAKWVGFSADYTFQSGVDILHQAVRFTLPKGQVLDSLLFEDYERVDPGRDYGFNVFGERAVGKRFAVGGGFVRTGPGLLNADRFPPGKRVYFNTTLKISPEFSFITQFTQGVGRISPAIPRTRVDVILSYNILASLKRTGLF